MNELDDLIGGPRFGRATFGTRSENSAEFLLSGRETNIKISDAGGPRYGASSVPLIQVNMIDGRKLAFLDNVRTEAVSYHGGDGSIVTYMPHFVIVGQSHVPLDFTIEELTFTVHNAVDIFYDFDAFSIDIAAGRRRISEIVEDRSQRIGRNTDVGDRPIIAYFSGKFEIVSADAGDIYFTARHQPTAGMGGPGGVSIKNKIRVSLKFRSPRDRHDAIDGLLTVLRFFQIIAGQKQSLSDLRVKVVGAGVHEWHSLYWCLAWSSEKPGTRRPNPADVPVNGGVHPDAFAQALVGWLATEEQRIDARVRFSRSFEMDRDYGPDRLVAAANIFDLLPPECFRKTVELSSGEEEAKAQAIALFKALPGSDIRSRALGDLGRLGRPNLKTKILDRARAMIVRFGTRLPHLELVLRDAVDARNHFVHGTVATPEEAQLYRDSTPFYIRTLEATFAIAELLDCGWNPTEWLGGAKGDSHPFADLLVHYPEEIADYRQRRAAAR